MQDDTKEDEFVRWPRVVFEVTEPVVLERIARWPTAEARPIVKAYMTVVREGKPLAKKRATREEDIAAQAIVATAILELHKHDIVELRKHDYARLRSLSTSFGEHIANRLHEVIHHGK